MFKCLDREFTNITLAVAYFIHNCGYNTSRPSQVMTEVLRDEDRGRHDLGLIISQYDRWVPRGSVLGCLYTACTTVATEPEVAVPTL
jgi:hypothetical protein